MTMANARRPSNDESAPEEQNEIPGHETRIEDRGAPSFAEHRCPSLTYKEARSTIVYRLSEAMFASLLATYIIGFVSFLAPIWEGAPPILKRDPIESLQAIGETLNLLSVSLVFSFMTASIYLKYNMSVLTMPSYDQYLGSRDFSFAVIQGLFFGASIVYPPLLSFWCGVLLLISIVIQFAEHNALVEVFNQVLIKRKPDRHAPEALKSFERKVVKFIQNSIRESGFPEWECVKLRDFIIPILLVVLGVAATAAGQRWQAASLLFSVGLNVILCAVLVFVAYRTISKSAGFFKRDDDGTYPPDQKFKDLVHQIESFNNEQ